MLGRLVGSLAVVSLLSAPASSAPVTFQIDGYFNSAFNFTGTWSGLTLTHGDPFVAFLTLDDAATPIASDDQYPNYRSNTFPITSFDVAFTNDGASVVFATGTLRVTVSDYDSNLSVSLRALTTQADGSTVSHAQEVAYEARTRLSEPTMEEALYLMDQQGETEFRGLSLLHNGGTWDYGTCVRPPGSTFGQCSLAMRTDKVSIITPGYTPSVPPGAQNPVPAPVPLPAGAILLASGIGLLGYLKLCLRGPQKSEAAA